MVQRLLQLDVPIHSGREAEVNVTGRHAAQAARGAIAKLIGTVFSGRDDARGSAARSTPPTVMLTQPERADVHRWRARAAAELQSIREDGLLGRGWRKHPRTLFLLGYLSGTTARIDADNAARN